MTEEPYNVIVERSFRQLKDKILGGAKTGTNIDDVLAYMNENRDRIWFMSWEFVGKVTKAGRYLSHKAPARASDLAIFHSHLVEDRKIGRFKAYRLRLENENLIQKRLGLKETIKPSVKIEAEMCEHNLPKYVACPYCKKT